jgi:hypothetical protein
LKIARVSPTRLARLTVLVAIAVAAVFATTASAGRGGGDGNKPKYTPCLHVFNLDHLKNAVAQETGTAPEIKTSPDSPPGRADPKQSNTGGPITWCESFFPEGVDSNGHYGFGNATAYGYIDGYVAPAWGWVVGTDVSMKAFKKLRTDYRDPPLPGGESGEPYTTQDFTPAAKGSSGFVGVVDMTDSVNDPPTNAYEYYVFERTKNGGLLMLHTWPLSLGGSEAAVNAAVNALGKKF